jgi:hypothetical protein
MMRVSATSGSEPVLPGIEVRSTLYSSWVEVAQGRSLPAVLLLVLVVVLLGIASLGTPIEGRGDFGQWLMTSRHYLGREVPDYRSISTLPPLVPLLIAGVNLLVPDPVAVLNIVNLMALAGIGVSFFLVGAVVLRGSIDGFLTAVVALLVTDRYLELLSFGGLLQAASIVFTNLAVAGFVYAARQPEGATRWWLAGSTSLAMVALSHVGTALVAVPSGLLLAGLLLLPQRERGWRSLSAKAWPLLVAVVVISVYWSFLLLPAGEEYVTNPASLAYRGPAKLFVGLFSFWPTILVLIGGGAAILLGVVREAAYRGLGTASFLLAWSGLLWASLTFAVLTDASTDYPRFATLLLAPVVVGAAWALSWLAHALTTYAQDLLGATGSPRAVLAIAGIFALVLTPFATLRYETVLAFYPPSDPAALTAAVRYVDDALVGNEYGTVLSTVREGKWLEGMTGREALFSQPVRFAFRPAEWKRSVHADALLKSTAAIGNQFFFGRYEGFSNLGGRRVPRDLVVSVNHLGEFVELLQVRSADTRLIMAADGSMATAESGPGQLTSVQSAQDAQLTTEWDNAAAGVVYRQSVSLRQAGPTLTFSAEAPGAQVRTELRAAHGTSITSMRFVGREAEVCFRPVADVPPCLRIEPAQTDVTFAAEDQGITVQATSRLTLYITALTPGGPSIDLAVLIPRDLLATHQIGAAILLTTEPDFAFRRERLEALGMRVGSIIGPYAVMLRH